MSAQHRTTPQETFHRGDRVKYALTGEELTVIRRVGKSRNAYFVRSKASPSFRVSGSEITLVEREHSADDTP